MHPTDAPKGLGRASTSAQSQQGPQVSGDILARLGVLGALEQRACQHVLSTVYGDCGLWLRPPWVPVPGTPPLLDRLLDLQLDGARLRGPLDGQATRLPVRSGSQALVVLQHAADLLCAPEPLLDEASRVLLPNGVLLLLGFNPISPAAWRLQLSARRAGLLLELPRHPAAWWQRRLARCSMEGMLLRHLGPVLGSPQPPGNDDEALLRAHPLRAVSVLLAQKRFLRPALRRSASRQPVPQFNPGWVAGRRAVLPSTISGGPGPWPAATRPRALALRARGPSCAAGA